jgi:hypothetical protein
METLTPTLVMEIPRETTWGCPRVAPYNNLIHTLTPLVTCQRRKVPRETTWENTIMSRRVYKTRPRTRTRRKRIKSKKHLLKKKKKKVNICCNSAGLRPAYKVAEHNLQTRQPSSFSATQEKVYILLHKEGIKYNFSPSKHDCRFLYASHYNNTI